MKDLLGKKVECEDFNNLDKAAMITIVEKAENIIQEINKACAEHEKTINKIISDVNKIEKQFKDVDESLKGKTTSVITAITSRLSFLVTLRGSITKTYANVLKEHSNSIQELFYLSDAYLDDGEFTDTEESDYILEGGIF